MSNECDVVLDIETERSFDEIRGRNNLADLGVTVVGTYDYKTDSYYAFERHEFGELADLLKSARRIIGFNTKDFDFPVLAPHLSVNIFSLHSLDLMEGVIKAAGFRISLGSLAKATLGAEKSGNGLDAILWWRAGDKERVKSYCLQDVRLTKELFEHGAKNGNVFFESKYGGAKTALPVRWNELTEGDVLSMLKAALSERRRITLTYGELKKEAESLVDVIRIDQRYFEAYCHGRKGKRTFQLEQVRKAVFTDQFYQLEEDVQRSLI